MNSKITLKFPFKMSLISIISVFLFADLITLGYFESPIYTLIQYISLLIVGIFVILQIRYIKFQDMMFLFRFFKRSSKKTKININIKCE